MQKRLTAVLALVLGLMTVSSAAHALDEGADQTSVEIDGAGALAAHGHGHVEIDGSGWARLTMHGDITITIGDDTTIKTRTLGADAADTVDGPATVTLEGFVGVIVVRGADFHISATGDFRRVFAKGEGVAFLQGRGWYRATGGYFGTWTVPGVRVSYRL